MVPAVAGADAVVDEARGLLENRLMRLETEPAAGLSPVLSLGRKDDDDDDDDDDASAFVLGEPLVVGGTPIRVEDGALPEAFSICSFSAIRLPVATAAGAGVTGIGVSVTGAAGIKIELFE